MLKNRDICNTINTFDMKKKKIKKRDQKKKTTYAAGPVLDANEASLSDSDFALLTFFLRLLFTTFDSFPDASDVLPLPLVPVVCMSLSSSEDLDSLNIL